MMERETSITIMGLVLLLLQIELAKEWWQSETVMAT